MAIGSYLATHGPAAAEEDTYLPPRGDLDAVERAFLEYPDEIAGMIIEPVMMNIGIVEPRPGYLQALRDACEKHGAVLIYDEVKTGFATAPGMAEDDWEGWVALTTAIGSSFPSFIVKMVISASLRSPLSSNSM